jgi:hypothetical protein
MSYPMHNVGSSVIIWSFGPLHGGGLVQYSCMIMLVFGIACVLMHVCMYLVLPVPRSSIIWHTRKRVLVAGRLGTGVVQ